MSFLGHFEKLWRNSRVTKQGRIHGYPNPMRTGRIRVIGHLGRSSEAKDLIKVEKNIKWTNRWTDK